MMHKHLVNIVAVIGMLLLSACWDSQKTGPDDIHWDRDTCELCLMFISEARFTAQVRGGPKHKLYKFDDIGCAINWLNGQDWASDPNTEIWVAGENSTRKNVDWLNAREARYIPGELSPMNYGYIATRRSEGIGFVAMTSAILTNSPNHICKVPNRNE